MKKRVVLIGGGHGLATLITGLKKLNNISLTAIVSVSDSGGSTGRLRQIYDMPAIGDIRHVMHAMANKETILRYLMNYRFFSDNTLVSNNEDVLGHNLGNLILKAMMDYHDGNLSQAIISMSKLLNVKGKVVPSSLESLTLYAKMMDGTIVKGEANIPNATNSINYVYFDHVVQANSQAIAAIERADYIILGIGSLFTSILPNIIIPELRQSIVEQKVPILYYCNVMSELGETDHFSLEDHVATINRHGLKVDGVITYNNIIPENILKHYQDHQQSQVIMKDTTHDYKVISLDLLTYSDTLIRHDPNKIAETFPTILQGF